MKHSPAKTSRYNEKEWANLQAEKEAFEDVQNGGGKAAARLDAATIHARVEAQLREIRNLGAAFSRW